ncbi:Trimeric GatFAB AmidoTransferase(AdT) complex subunit [Ophidiomyces ophidiicola]|uniref:Trimeric GatFAB AmidoTransferase(AdT) complex subunit n=1 Tax=Ophidiomyces ophidiicola TaxID=1387563 RepID=A0ACB8UX83_9EURO|nr:Trimeric GatFAB AmidoTransferase(AdT) complex subunit [Ophidiomyces ophidiicola]KAI1914932.1 Trimeric GatFAB AmidoTransferase(AdT) complex subunit [Ophidiomyces ophidiicola]KAI1916707.1 Trimeric GatFAB AmidoTransferase(AdT) complex subunit [Ophidiomyces ophidiicola]KAI1928015.1 Trimeric GatFAB AmidoTransferase(AdT) complex subunit [Ophidiomyces ophidiicola]KAI1945759.1 Trimeric GatFAB AmidoTransferase(AdT) complex subunit [Ophidiomyces ophidiicola]KAI1950677.1 Trimeric GatFAB AmidoTransfera
MSLLREAEKCLANQKTFGRLNAFISPLDRAGSWIDRVKDADARRKQGVSKSPLDGKFIGVKDNICTRDFRTTCGSGMLEHFTSPFNATVVELLNYSGAVVAGKTNMDEFGMGSHSTYSHFGAVKSNCIEGTDTKSAGGSSGGSAVAVSTGQCYAALGTDTGGSVRLPAAYTGTFGFKPSYGLVSRFGVVAYANSLDTVGVIGPNTTTLKEVFGVINKYDPQDPTSLPPDTRTYMGKATHSLAKYRRDKLRIGVPLEYNLHELSPFVREAWQNSLSYLQSQGHTIHPVSLPTSKQALSAYYILAPAEASSNLAKYDGVRYGTRDINTPDNAGGCLYANTRGSGFGSEVKRRIVLGAFTLSAEAMDNYFIQAQKVRRLVQSDFNTVFRLRHPLLSEPIALQGQTLQSDPDNAGKVDVLVCPTAPSPPPSLRSLEDILPIQAYINDVFTVPASLVGLPALSVPVPFSRVTASNNSASMPVGIQVIGQFGDDELVLNVGAILEQIDM